MGQMAEDVLDGFMCSWCGVCFEKEHGYPVVCEDCAEGKSDAELEKLGIKKATEKEL